MKFLLFIAPFLIILLAVIMVLAIIASLFSSEQSVFQANFALPFDSQTYTITSEYGMRDLDETGEIKMHNAIDVVPTSPNILSVADGIVITSEVYSDGCEAVVIEHRIGNLVYHSGYLHLKENSRVVSVGDEVKQGQQIGIMGNTGNVRPVPTPENPTAGTHLHFYLQKFNVINQRFEYIDPTIVFTNNIIPKEQTLYDYQENQFKNPYLEFPNTLPTRP